MKRLETGNRQIDTSRVASLGQSGGESARLTPQPSPLDTENAVEILRELKHAFAAVLINAQVLDGKTPNYSRSKRYIHEIERSAQRGGAQLKRLLEQFPAEGAAAGCESEMEFEGVPPVAERTAVMASQGPTAAPDGELDYGALRSGTCGP